MTSGPGSVAVTVVIPTFNRRRFLGRAIESVLKQDNAASVELIVVDDASTDGTSAWLTEAYPRLRLIRQDVNRGVSAARNAGLAAGRGEFIAFLDDDDWWDPAFLRRHRELLSSRPDAVLSYGDFMSVDTDGGASFLVRAREMDEDPIKLFLLGNPIPSLSIAFMRREAARRAGGFREDYPMSEDREFYMRFLSLGAFIHDPRPLTFKARSADAQTRNLRVWTAAAQRLLDDFFSREESSRYRDLESPARARWHARLALACLRGAGTRFLGLKMIATALLFDPRGTARYAADRLRARRGRPRAE